MNRCSAICNAEDAQRLRTQQSSGRGFAPVGKALCGRALPRGHGPSLSARVLRLHEFGGFGGRCPLEQMTFKEGLSKAQRQYGV
jgi:hypothetical protein